MPQKSVSPVPRSSAGTGLGEGSCEAAVSNTELSTERLIEERLQRRFGISPEVARVLADLMAQHGGFFSREVRCG
jgi:hypothetical protein